MTLETSATEPSEGVFSRWVGELCFTWLAVVLFCVLPAALFGSAILSVGVLVVVIFFSLPFALFGSVSKDSSSRRVRRFVVMLAVPVLTLAYVAEVDRRIPGNAAQLAQAIESFHQDMGRYPASIGALDPEYLPELPHVRFSVVQPPITYRITDGKPYLAIPSAMGDMFAQFEYDFESKAWLHHS